MSKRILSFDVGIKNLAYCLIEFKNDPSNNHVIYDWGIINIIDNLLDETIKCSAIKRGGGNCIKDATNYVISNNNTIGFCSNKGCQAKLNTTFTKEQIKKIKKQNTKSFSLFEIGISLIKNLYAIPGLLDVDEIVIENQPVLKNPTMKSIQMILYTYFLVNKCSLLSSVNNIYLFSARNKLNIYDGPEIECTKSNEYAKRKYLSIEYTKYFLAKIPDRLSWFNEHKKKDDLADCYLQALTFYKSHNPTNVAKKTKSIRKTKKTDTSKDEIIDNIV